VLSGVLGAPLTAAVFALGLTGDFNALLPLLLATGVSYGFTIMVMRRSIMTEKIARRGLHIYREYSVDPQERSFVGEVMTADAITIDSSLTLREVAQQYFGADQKHRAFPVLNRKEVLIGVVDRAALEEGMRVRGEEGTLAMLFDNTTPSVAFPVETCQVVARRMAKQNIERLPVVDSRSRHLVGIVSRSDLVKPSQRAYEEEHVRERFFGN
jgi:CBS domain-containing protein